MPEYNAFIINAATAHQKCSYCRKDLTQKASLYVCGSEKERYICPDCFIKTFDGFADKK